MFVGTEGIKLRQLQYDIEHMKSEEGWSIDFDESLKKGRKKAKEAAKMEKV